MSHDVDARVDEPHHLGLERGVAALHVFVVEPDDLLLLADDARLAQRRAPVIDRQQVDAGLGGARFSVAPPSSLPTSAMSVARPPSDTMFAAVFAAPPSTRLDESDAAATGTGASGEIRLQSPSRYSSRIASPSTSTRLSWNAETSCRGRIHGVVQCHL